MFHNYTRYCLRVKAIDHTDCATLVIFDKEATGLFNKSCVDMLAEHGVVSDEICCGGNLCLKNHQACSV